MMKYLAASLSALALASGLFLFFQSKNVSTISVEKEITTSTLAAATAKNIKIDIENQKPLANPPKVIKAIYATSWSASSEKKVDYFINFIKSQNLNAIVIDIKDYSGLIAYDIQNADVEKYHAKEVRMPRINTLIKRLHDEGIYVIARVTVFQDPALVKARPDLAVRSKATEGVWYDNKKLSWIDATSKEAWSYNVEIAKDALARGFDEINFDYIRFPSDGNMADMKFSALAERTPKHVVMSEFFKYLREELGEAKLSADLFGLSTINKDDLGIGQVIEDAYTYFDFVAPMIYPSHYATGFLGFKNPAAYPYEVVAYSVAHAQKRLLQLQLIASAEAASTSTINKTTPSPRGKLRPWLQDFNLGATYDAEKVRLQIKALEDTGLADGYMIWNASNIYTRTATSTN